MKSILIAAVLLVQGEAPGKCDMFAELAEGAMSARQEGMPFEVFTDMVGVGFPPEMRPGVMALGGIAYSVPLYPDEGDKQRVIDEFRTDILMACYAQESSDA